MAQALLGAFEGPGALFMYAITAVLAFVVAVTIERGWLFLVRWRVDAGAVEARVAEGRIAEAAELAGAHPVAALLRAGAGATGPEAAWDAMAGEAPLVEARVRQRVGALAAAGNVATLLGLLGTVYGLIIAFSALSDASAVERAARLSEGIATAMATTALGLLTAIPALAVHALLDGRAARILAWCEALAGRVAAARRG